MFASGLTNSYKKQILRNKRIFQTANLQIYMIRLTTIFPSDFRLPSTNLTYMIRLTIIYKILKENLRFVSKNMYICI